MKRIRISAGGVLLLLFALAVGALILYTATYTAGL